MSAVAGIVDAGLFKRQYRDHRLEWMLKTGGTEIVLSSRLPVVPRAQVLS